MTTLREAAEMALEALKQSRPKPCDEDDDYAELAWKKQTAAIDFLRKALDADSMASLPEPVAYVSGYYAGRCVVEPLNKAMVMPEGMALYTATPRREWAGMTDEEIEDEWERITGHSIFGGDRSNGRLMYLSSDEVTEFIRAIEAKLKEKNT